MAKFLLVTHGIQLDIDITPNGPARTWVPLGEGIENMDEALNEVANEYQFFANKGYAVSYVTGMSITVNLSGRRIVGDQAQDYICSSGVKYGLMASRQTTARLSQLTGDGKVVQITCPATFTNIVDISGAATDGSALTATLHLDGEPQMETVTPGTTLTVNSVAGASTGDTVLTTTPASPTAGCKFVYSYGTEAPEATAGSVINGWNVFNSGAQYTIANGQHVTVALINTATNVVIMSGTALVVSKAS